MDRTNQDRADTGHAIILAYEADTGGSYMLGHHGAAEIVTDLLADVMHYLAALDVEDLADLVEDAAVRAIEHWQYETTEALGGTYPPN